MANVNSSPPSEPGLQGSLWLWTLHTFRVRRLYNGFLMSKAMEVRYQPGSLASWDLFLPPLPALTPSPTSLSLTVFRKHSPSSYPTRCVVVELCVFRWEAGRHNIGCEVDGQSQLQHCNVTPKGMKLLKVWVFDDTIHRHLLSVLCFLV